MADPAGNEKLFFPVKKSNKSPFFAKIRYWWSWFVAGLLMLVVALPALVILWLIGKPMWLHPLGRWGAGLWLMASGSSVSVIDRAQLDAGKTYVFAANHRSYLDTATLFFYTGKKIGLVAKRELLKVPVLGQGMGFVNIIAIDRTNPERALSSMEKAREVVKNGYSFGVFVEGTRAMPGELLPFKKGAFHLALQTGTDIVPVAIKNTDHLMKKRTGTAFPGTIEMVLLPPIETAGKTADDVMELLLATRRAIVDELRVPAAGS